MRILRMAEHPEESNQKSLNKRVADSYKHETKPKEFVGKVKTM